MPEMFPVSPGILFNVDKAIQLVADRRPNYRCHIPSIIQILRDGNASTAYDRVRKDKIKPDMPVFMLPVYGVPILVDGWHRCRWWHRQGRVWLPAHLLTEEEAASCIKRRSLYVKV